MNDAAITIEEFTAFADIVANEATSQGIRMIDMWAGSADADSKVLTATFALMWRV